MLFEDQNPHILKLNSNNFTPLSRTPWAGEKIARYYKGDFLEHDQHPSKIGESWEFSCDPEFPSLCIEYGLSLSELAKRYKSRVLQEKEIELLLKIIDTGADLSLQVHPEDSDPNLLASECGKPESWLILDHEEGAGIYLGFNKEYSKEEIRLALLANVDMRPFLQFVPVQKNDYFDLQPGVPHAIGKGVTLLEPQRILFGKSGKTFRMYDWNRKYNELGILDPEGKPRVLHIEESLRLIDPQTQWGEQFVNSLRVIPKISYLGNGAKIHDYGKNPHYKTLRILLAKGSELLLEIKNSYCASIVLNGTLQVCNKWDERKQLEKGRPAFWPYNLGPVAIRSLDPVCDLVLITDFAGEINLS